MALKRIDFATIQSLSSSEAFRTELARMYEAALKLGFEVYYDAELRDIQLLHGNGTMSDLVDADLAHLETVSTMLKLMSKMRESTKIISRQSDLERRVEAIEGLLLNATITAEAPSENSKKYTKSKAERISELTRRAEAIGNSVSKSYVRVGLTYVRHRRRARSDKGPNFTVHNAFDKNHHNRDNIRWSFGYDELELLEKFIEHDEKIYADFLRQKIPVDYVE